MLWFLDYSLLLFIILDKTATSLELLAYSILFNSISTESTFELFTNNLSTRKLFPLVWINLKCFKENR